MVAEESETSVDLVREMLLAAVIVVAATYVAWWVALETPPPQVVQQLAPIALALLVFAFQQRS